MRIELFRLVEVLSKVQWIFEVKLQCTFFSSRKFLVVVSGRGNTIHLHHNWKVEPFQWPLLPRSELEERDEA